MDIDINIDHYDYFELLNIYKIDNDLTYNEILDKLNIYLPKIKKGYDSHIYNFYLKAYKIIICINKILDEKVNNKNKDKIPYLEDKIKKIDCFELYTPDEIIELIKNKNTINSIKQEEIIDSKQLTEQPLIDTNKQISSTNLVSVAPGDLNIIKRVTQLININLNSCFRDKYFNSNPCDFMYTIPNSIKNAVSMKLASIEIPNAWYLFSYKKKNNIFDIEICDTCDNFKNHTIVIPDGNYDFETLTDFLNETYFCESQATSELKYLRFYIDRYNFKSRFEIVNECISPFTYTLNFGKNANDNIIYNAGWLLGFRLMMYKSINGNIQSEGLFDGGGDRYIYFSINDYQYNKNTSNLIGFDKSTMENDIIAKIPMNDGKLSLIIDQTNPLNKTRNYNGPVNINKLHIKILDKYGDIIDLNHMDFSFTLEIETLYESFNFNNVKK